MQESFSVLAAIGGVVGVGWLELMRVVSRITRGRRLWYGLKKWQYGMIVAGFMVIAACFAGFAVDGFVSAVFIGFGVEGGPVATGILGTGGGAGPQKQKPRVEDGANQNGSSSGVREFFTEA